jgi:uncharacterized protein
VPKPERAVLGALASVGDGSSELETLPSAQPWKLHHCFRQLRIRRGRSTSQEQRQDKDVPQRMLWMTIGLLATVCGIVGTILPLVPTTPFLLLAAYAFARSSAGLHAWLVTHPRLGPPIRHWNNHGAISGRVKIATMIVMAASMAISAAAGVRLALILLQATALAAAAGLILSRPTAIEE